MFSTTQLSTSRQKLERDRPVGRAWEEKLRAHSLAESYCTSVRKLFSIGRLQWGAQSPYFELWNNSPDSEVAPILLSRSNSNAE